MSLELDFDLGEALEEQGLLELDSDLSEADSTLLKSVLARIIMAEDQAPTAAESLLVVKDILKLSTVLNDGFEFEGADALCRAGQALVNADASGEAQLAQREVALLLIRAEAARGLEEFEDAMDHSRAAILLLADEAFEMPDDKRKLSQAGAYMDVSQTAMMIDNLDQALKSAQAALSLYQGAGDKTFVGKANEQIADVKGQMGDRDEAIGHINKAVEIYAEAQDMPSLSAAFARLGQVQMDGRKWEAAEQAVLPALAAAPKADEKTGERSHEFDGAMMALVRLVKAQPDRREILVHRVAEVAELSAGKVSALLVQFEGLSEMGLGGFE